ncbi:hypothetical protein ACKWTF_014452 [Chironomus riparius]
MTLILFRTSSLIPQFLDFEFKEQYSDILTFYLTNLELRYSKIFKILAEVKEEMHIEDYTLTQMSLEQVFLNITQQNILSAVEAIQIKTDETTWRSGEISDRKAKKEAERKAKEEADRSAKAEAGILAEEEDERKTKDDEADLKISKKADRKAKKDAAI